MRIENRRYHRTEVNWPVTIETPEGSIEGETTNISSGGAFISCKSPLTANEVFEMFIHIQDRENSLRGKVEVVWLSPRGMGVKFHPDSHRKP
ncbi:MAG: PilZ domain-containing protein [Deltaproteobacteria bacterium]|nr:MAG: PilZ domain-containing protein [Deltaproteobacteria bacterium]